MIDQWLRIPYQDYGRDWSGCDCWGLVRLVRQALRGDMLPSYGAIYPGDKQALTHAAHAVMSQDYFNHADPALGTIATVWRGGLCLHVGIVIQADGRLAVLETGRHIGVRWLRLDDFVLTYGDVRWYDNCH